MHSLYSELFAMNFVDFEDILEYVPAIRNTIQSQSIQDDGLVSSIC